MGLSGVQRTLKFVKYFSHFGWQSTVLTVEPIGYFAHDETLLEDLSRDEVRIVRTRAAGPGRLFARKGVVKIPSELLRKFLSRVSDTFFVPDNKIGWKRKAVSKAVALHKETPFDIIFATAPPFTDFLIGSRIKAEINKPLVLDYRDPWVDYPFKFYPTPLHKWRNIVQEKNALRASSHVITTNRRVKEILIKRYPFFTYYDIDIIPQGFDPEDFKTDGEAGRTRRKKSASKSDVMIITYTGVFWEDRVPDYFLRALHDLFEKKPDLRGHIEAWFIGSFREENFKLVDRLGLKDSVRIFGYLPHRECIRHILGSDVLWMIVGDDVGSPGKAYEYIGARKPILGCVPDGFLKTAILEAGGKVVPPKDVNGIERAIEEYFIQFQKRQLKGPEAHVIEKYNRRTLTGSLVKIFESLIEP